MTSRGSRRGIQFDYPEIDSTPADLVLVTHEHADHNSVETIRGDPMVLRSTAGSLRSPIGEITAIASEHDNVAGTARGPHTIFVFEFDGLRNYRTPRIGFLETADAFLELAAHVERLPRAAFDTGELTAQDKPVVLVSAAP